LCVGISLICIESKDVEVVCERRVLLEDERPVERDWGANKKDCKRSQEENFASYYGERETVREYRSIPWLGLD